MYYAKPAINQPAPHLAKWHVRWRKNRDFVNGSDAVKARKELYLPRTRKDDGPSHYASLLLSTSFYPAASAIATGVVGLIERKPYKLETASPKVELLARSITYRNQSLKQLGSKFLREKIITNFNLLFADHPGRDGFTGLNAENAERKGFRPRVSLYVGESILDYQEGPVGLEHKVVEVRLLEEDGKRVRHCFLDDNGFYEQHIYHADASGTFNEAEYQVVIPTIDGERMTEIPVVLDTSEGGVEPTPSIIERAVDLNHEHYLLSGKLANMTWQVSGPLVFISNFSRELDDDGNEIDPEWDFGPNGVIELKGDSKPEYFKFDPSNSSLITNQLDKLEMKLSSLNHSIIAAEKAAPENSDVIILRRVAESATLAGFTGAASDSMNRVLNFWSKWVDGSEVVFQFNTDFTPAGISSEQHKAIQDDFTLGIVPHNVALQALIDGEVYPSTLDVDATIEQAKNDQADRPTLGV